MLDIINYLLVYLVNTLFIWIVMAKVAIAKYHSPQLINIITFTDKY